MIVVFPELKIELIAGATDVSDAINLGTILGRGDLMKPDGFFSAQCIVAGDGEIDLIIEVSNDATNWATGTQITSGGDESNTKVREGMTALGGPYLAGFSLPLAKYLRFSATEKTGTDNADVSIIMAMQ
jgi:hypothetical protein